MTIPNTQPQPKIALITGVTGQDGAYLAERLQLTQGYLERKRHEYEILRAEIEALESEAVVCKALFGAPGSDCPVSFEPPKQGRA